MRRSVDSPLLIVGTLLALHATLLVWIGGRNSPNDNEIAHLPAGISHWKFGNYRLYRVNPPLVRMVAAAPLALVHVREDWTHLHRQGVPGRREWPVAEDFVAANGPRMFRLFALARWACVPFSLLGAYVCFRWADELYGREAAYLALALWVFDPNILGNAAMITPDTGAAAMGVAAGYAFWRWLRSPGWPRSFVAGVALGIAELTKTTWIVLYALWPLLAFAWHTMAKDAAVRPQGRPGRVGQLLLILILSLCLLNAAYRFQGAGTRLDEYRFVSNSLGGGPSARSRLDEGANRFTGTLIGAFPLPLPRDYVLGIDMQKRNFEDGTWSYLCGKWKLGGWWYYYLYALAVKVPLGTWCLVGLAVGATLLGRSCSASWPDEIVLLLPPLVILLFVSSQTGFSAHLRYAIPAMPFLFIWTGKVARVSAVRPLTRRHLAFATMLVGALTWSVASSLAVYPHSLSYFNELAGGPRRGGEHLLGSNLDWGQDLLYLKDWLDRHEHVKLDGLAYQGAYPARLAGVPETPYPPPGPQDVRRIANAPLDRLGPKPGWYALSVNSLRDRSRRFEHFLRFRPTAMAGYSIHIYHLTLDDANRVRRELGLPQLSNENIQPASRAGRDVGRRQTGAAPGESGTPDRSPKPERPAQPSPLSPLDGMPP